MPKSKRFKDLHNGDLVVSKRMTKEVPLNASPHKGGSMPSMPMVSNTDHLVTEPTVRTKTVSPRNDKLAGTGSNISIKAPKSDIEYDSPTGV